jgi:hypothetical protein
MPVCFCAVTTEQKLLASSAETAGNKTLERIAIFIELRLADKKLQPNFSIAYLPLHCD